MPGCVELIRWLVAIKGRVLRPPVLLCMGFVASAAHAGPGSSRGLADLSIEELMDESITSVSRKEQRLGDTAAAVSVLTNEDLQRSGVTTIADALRLVPGVQVAAIDSSHWAVSVRGFNSQFANKLLAMIDGRTIYSPLFSGVYWDVQQTMLYDVDRIEVIRGPGATVWGANAVNGVINVLSKSARDTQGGLIYGGTGDAARVLGGARHGGKIGDDTYYRFHGRYQSSDDFAYAGGQSANDRWDIKEGGYRVDRYTEEGHLTWQGDAYAGRMGDYTSEVDGFNTIGRWSHRLSESAGLELQAFVDHNHRRDALAETWLDTLDLSSQQTVDLDGRNAVVWGLGYRFTRDRVDNPGERLRILDDDISLHLFSAFIQDEIRIVPDKLFLTLGTKLEHNDFTGFELQPSARLAFKAAKNHMLWAAVSRAVRTPSEVEGNSFVATALGAPVVGPGGGSYVPTAVGNPQADAEELWAYELGHRGQVSDRFSVDVAIYYNLYRNLLVYQPAEFIPGVPVGTMSLQANNTMRADSYGGEVSLLATATDSWRLSASYSLLLLDVQGEAISEAPDLERNAPTHQLVLRSEQDLSARVSFDAQLRYVDQVQSVPSYVTADLRLSYRPSERLELAVGGQNLLDDAHPEQASLLGLPIAEVPRSFYARISQRF